MLQGQSLPKNAWEKFEDIKGKINTAWVNLANVIAKYREEMMDVLKSYEAKWTDETTLNDLITKLENKKWAELEPDLWKTSPCKIDLSNNGPITLFWRSIVNGANIKLQWKPGTTPATPWDITNINTKITEALNSIQFLHDNWLWNREKTWKLFKGSSTEMTDIEETLKDSLISEVLDETDHTKVAGDVDNFVKSVWTKEWNAFYIYPEKLYTDEQRETAIRISLYLYCAYKIANDPTKITKELCNDINEKLDQIIGKEIPKIKWLHNTKVELWYLKPEYETLRDLNTKDTWDIDLWSHNLAPTSQSFTHDLTPEYEAWIATNIEKYELKESEVKVTDAAWNTYAVSFLDVMWNSWDLSCDLNDTKPVDFHIEVWWHKIKIWRLMLSNLAWNAKFQIDIDDETTINTAFAAAWVAMPAWPIDFDIWVKWIKKVNNSLKGCCASLKRIFKLKLATTAFVPPPPPPPPWGTFDVEASLSNVTEVSREEAERVAEEQLRERYANLARYSPDRINLFLRRDYIKEKYVQKIMKGEKWLSWNERDLNATERQQLQASQGTIFDAEVTTVDMETEFPLVYAQIDALCNNFVWTPPACASSMPEDIFMEKFEEIVNEKDNPDLIKKLWKERLLTYSSNILFRMKMFKAHQQLVDRITKYVAAWHTDPEIDTFSRNEIKKYMEAYNDLPGFLEKSWLNLEDPKFWYNVRVQAWVLAGIAAQTMKLKMKIITKWSAAYKIKQKNKWRVAKTWDVIDSGFFKKWKQDKCPPWILETFWWMRWFARTWVVVWAWIAWWMLFWPLWTAAFTGVTVWLRTLFSKYSHYTKEHEWQMKNEAVDLAYYEKERKRLRKLVSTKWRFERLWLRWKDRKDIRHRNRYVNTTHWKSEHTTVLANNISALANKDSALTATEETALKDFIAEWFARLVYYKRKWQNFLWSDDVKKAEEDYKNLYGKLISWAKRVWWVRPDGKIDKTTIQHYWNYKATMDVIRDSYWKADAKFKSKRRKLWIWNAVVTWAVAWWLSYLTTKIWKRSKIWEWDEHNFQTPWDHLATDPMVHAEQWGWTNSLHDVFQNAMSDPSNAHATWYKLVVSPEVDSLPTWAASSHNFTSLSSKISSISVPTDPDSAAAFHKAMTLRANREHIPFYKRSPLEKALAFAKNHWADTGNQYLFWERFAETVSNTLQARVDAGMTGVPIDNIVFWKSAASATESVAGSAWNLAERSMNWVLVIKKPGSWVWIPISRNTFKRKEGKVKPKSTAGP